MSSPWCGGSNYILIRRGSNNGRKGGSHSGPSGYRVGKFYADLQNSKVQSETDKAKHLADQKAGKRHSIMKISSLIRYNEPERYAKLISELRKN